MNQDARDTIANYLRMGSIDCDNMIDAIQHAGFLIVPREVVEGSAHFLAESSDEYRREGRERLTAVAEDYATKLRACLPTQPDRKEGM